MNDTPSPIVGLDGQPITPTTEKRYAIVGQVNIHWAVYELKEGEDEAHAVRTHNILVRKRDPIVQEITNSQTFFWCEDDRTRPIARHGLLQQCIALFANLLPNGQRTQRISEKEIGDAVDAHLNRVETKPGVAQCPHGFYSVRACAQCSSEQ